MMLCEFPNLIDWIDDYGMINLRIEFKRLRINIGFGQLVSFERFIEQKYNEEKLSFDNLMHRVNPINIDMDCEGEIDIESAKLVLRRMIEHCTDKGMILNVIEKEDLAPDYFSALHIVDAFWNAIIPKIEKALKD
jgi:hypothetical protein